MKKYNWKKGILFTTVCAVIGFAVGVLMVQISKRMEVYSFINSVKGMMPYLYIMALISGVVGFGGYIYFSVKLNKDNYSNEEGSFYERNEKLMNVLLMCATLTAVINFTAFGINIFNGHPLVVLFFVNGLLAFFGEVGYISLIKKVRPELNADPMSTNFGREYFDKLDECEKNKVGKASVKTITAMTPIYVGLFMGCYIVTVLLNISPVICLPIGIIWAVQTALYTYYSIKEER